MRKRTRGSAGSYQSGWFCMESVHLATRGSSAFASHTRRVSSALSCAAALESATALGNSDAVEGTRSERELTELTGVTRTIFREARVVVIERTFDIRLHVDVCLIASLPVCVGDSLWHRELLRISEDLHLLVHLKNLADFYLRRKAFPPEGQSHLGGSIPRVSPVNSRRVDSIKARFQSNIYSTNF